MQAGDTSGIDISLLKLIAADLHAQLQLYYGNESTIAKQLEEKKLDIAACGFKSSSVFKKKIGFTTPYLTVNKYKYVLGVTKGENAWVMYLEKFIYKHKGRISEMWQRKNTKL